MSIVMPAAPVSGSWVTDLTFLTVTVWGSTRCHASCVKETLP